MNIPLDTSHFKRGRTLHKLTDRSIKALTKPGRHSDGGGLYLEVRPGSLTKSFIFLHKKDGRQRALGMGGYPTVSLAMARERAAAARRLIAEGGDPFAERRKESEPTFGEAAARYVQSMQGQWRNRKTLGEWTTALARHCKSIWDMRVSEVDVPAVLAVLTPMWSKIPPTAARVRNRIEAILDYAKAHGWRTGENPARWKGGMSHLLPKRDKVERPHHAAMDYRDVPTFMTRLRGVRTMTARALEITVLTALRSGEVRSANWAEIDFDNAVWTLPANRMKAHRQHVVPLSSAALAILSELRAMGLPGEFVFPGNQAGQTYRRGQHDQAAQPVAGRCDGAWLPLGLPRLGG